MWGGEASRCSHPLRPCCGAAILAEGARELHWKQRTTDKLQSKVDEGWLLTRRSQFCAPTNPPQKDTICHWDWGEGVAGFDLVCKGRAGDKIIMRWTMMTTTMARAEARKSINDSISEHKYIVTSNTIYSIAFYHTKHLLRVG